MVVIRYAGHGSELDRRPQARFEQADQLAGLDVTLELRLREDALAVQVHLEAAFVAAPELHSFEDRRPAFEYLGRRANRAGNVVSGDAELDRHFVSGFDHRFERSASTKRSMTRASPSSCFKRSQPSGSSG